MQQMIFIADLIACSTCFGHHYAHYQELESIIQVVAACRIWFSSCRHGVELRVVCPVCGLLLKQQPIGLCLYRLLIKTTRNTNHLSLFSVSQIKMIASTRLSPATQPRSHPHDLQNYVYMHRAVLVPVPAVYFSNRRDVL